MAKKKKLSDEDIFGRTLSLKEEIELLHKLASGAEARLVEENNKDTIQLRAALRYLESSLKVLA